MTRIEREEGACHVLHPAERDRRVAALAARQHGVVATSQLAVEGISRRAIARRVERGHLRRLHRGVYLLGPLKAQFTDAMAAVLACGPGAVLSYHQAGVLWGIRPPDGSPVDVTVPGRNVRARAGIRIHRVRELSPAEATGRHGLPVTTAERTLLDLATVLAPGELTRTVEQAQIHGLMTSALNEQLARRHPGARALEAAHQPEPAFTRSEAEHRVLALIRKARLPHPSVNTKVHGYEVDLLWSAQRLIVEVDGYAFHSTRAAFERDRRRDADLQSHGYRVLRITWRQLTEEPEALIALVSAALARQ